MSSDSTSHGFKTHNFCFKSGSTLSNFFACTIVVWSVHFTSAEQAYQWYKATDHGYFNLAYDILCESNPYSILRKGKQVKTGKNWKNKKVSVMKHILCEKFDSCAPFRQELNKYKDYVLVEDTNNEFWGRGVSGAGRNLLGVLLTEVRHFKNV